jgi:hypothetical protein
MELSEVIESIGEWESEFESESAERARGRPAPRRPPNTPSFRPRPAPNAPQYVTQTQLEAALARSDAKIKTVADGVTTISARVNAVSTATRKEVDERRKALDTTSKDLNQKLQLMAMLPVLTSPTTVGPFKDGEGNTIPAVVVPDSGSLNKLLPLLLVTGLGGSGGFGGGGSETGGGDNGLMMMAMVLALAK